MNVVIRNASKAIYSVASVRLATLNIIKCALLKLVVHIHDPLSAGYFLIVVISAALHLETVHKKSTDSYLRRP